MNFISLEVARVILDTAFAEAARRGVRNAAVVVTDSGGNLRAAYRSDSWGNFGIDIATAKARTALGFGRATVGTAAIFKDNPTATAGLNGAVGGQFLPIGGGIVVTNTAGDVIGAAAFAGGMPEVDHEIVVAAVAAAGLSTLA
jgi:uncharacterized protein GlcG (DUF336 family)